MKRTVIALPLLLAACNSGEPSVSATNASASEVAAKVAASGQDIMITPGRWEGSVTVTDMKMPGLPPEQQAKLAGSIRKPDAIVSCVTPEQVKAHKAFFTGDPEADKSCKYDHFTMGNGMIDAVMACGHGEEKTAMSMKGSYSPERYQVTMTMDAHGGGPMGTMSSTSVIDAKRTGACKGDEKG